MKTCKHCKGSGRIAAPPEHRPKSTEDTFVDCPKCGGTGEGSYMIFWAYDLFPYILGATGTLEDDGMATVRSCAWPHIHASHDHSRTLHCCPSHLPRQVRR